MVIFRRKTLRQHQKFIESCCVLAASLFFMLSPIKLYASQTSASEIKASWIYTITDWLDWKTHPKHKKLIVCAVGRDKVYLYLSRAKKSFDKKKDGRQFIIKN
ncbi:MAG: hypothetical protein ACJATU_000637, partial [Rickettsiales bacterium]